MPPRYAFWTILIDQKPTSFRARDRDELAPTLFQLRRVHPSAEMKWFADGRLWDSPEQQQWARKNRESLREKRNRDWRPGGAHKDPRAKFQKSRRPAGPRDASLRTAAPKGDAPKGAPPKGPFQKRAFSKGGFSKGGFSKGGVAKGGFKKRAFSKTPRTGDVPRGAARPGQPSRRPRRKPDDE